VIRRLGLMADYAGDADLAALANRLCDTRSVTFSTSILEDFCKVFSIANARTSYDYILKGDYVADFEVRADLELLLAI
jgi:hypothetical protein